MNPEEDTKNTQDSDAISFDSKNIKRHEGEAYFTRIEGAEARAKEKAKAEAEKRKNAQRIIDRARRKVKDREEKIQRDTRRRGCKAKLHAIFWEGNHKKITIAVLVVLVLAALAYPAYLGIRNLAQKHEEQIIAEENERLNNLPENIQNDIYTELVDKYSSESYESGNSYFDEKLQSIEGDELTAKAYLSKANALYAVFDLDKIDEAISIAQEAQALIENKETYYTLQKLYEAKGDSVRANQYSEKIRAYGNEGMGEGQG